MTQEWVASYITDVPFNMSNVTKEVRKEENVKFDVTLWIYVSPLILLLGLIGNSLTIVVMRSKRYSGTNVKAYMMMMAICDCIFLLFTISPEWFDAMRLFTFKELHPFTCKLEKFIQYTAGDASVWILAAFTVDRTMAVWSPLRRRHACLPRHAWITSIGLCCVAVVKNLHVFWSRGLEHRRGKNTTLVWIKNCGYPPPFDDFEQFVRPWIAFSFVSVLPFCIICISNIVIIHTLMASRRIRKQSGINGQQQEANFRQTTIMCLSVSFAFLITVTPTIILLIGKPYWRKGNSARAYDIAKAINNQLLCVNHSINFWLYCITGEAFRDELRRIFGIAPRRTASETIAIANAALCLTKVTAFESGKQHGKKMSSTSKVREGEGEEEEQPLCRQLSRDSATDHKPNEHKSRGDVQNTD